MAERFAIDCRYLNREFSGIARSLQTLLLGLATLRDREEITLLTDAQTQTPEAASAAAGFAFVKVDYPPRSTANMLRLSRDLKRQGVTQLLCPDAFGPLVGSLRVAVMIHDLIPLTCAAQLRRSLKSRVPGLWRTWLKWQTRRAVGIVTVSEHSASDIANHLGVARDRIAVTPNALTPETLAACGQADPAPREDELLYVGRRDPYKGLATLARVLGRVRELTGRDVKLRIVGPEDLRYPQAQEEIDRLGLQSAVIDMGRVNEAELVAAYQRAKVFVFPSLYEGFGLPPLEAMAYGLPVVCSNRTSLPEVVEGAAVLVDPADEAGFAQAIAEVMTDLAKWQRLADAGRRRAERFTPARQAEAMLTALRRWGMSV